MSDEGEFYPAQTVVNCDFCDTHVNVTWVCDTCHVSICQKCKDIHLGKKKFRDHIVRLRGQERKETTIKTAKCQKHSSFDCSAFCESCKVPACIKCVVNDHKDHDVLELKEAYDEYRARLRSITDTFKSQNLTQVRERRKHLQYENEHMNTEATEALKILNRERTEVISVLNNVYDKLEKNVTQVQENEQKKIDESLESMNEKEGVIESILEQCEKYEAALDISIFKFVNECPDYSDFLPGEVCISHIKVAPGSINSSYIEQRVGSVLLDSSSESESLLRKSDTSVDDRKVRSFTAPLSNNENKGAFVMQNENSNEVWMSNVWSSDLYLYNSQGTRVTTMSAGFEIWGFEMDGNGDFIATDYDHETVKKISKTGKVTTLIKSLPARPLGVCVNHKQEIVLCLNTSNVIFVYTSDGSSLIHKIGEEKGLFTQPYRLTQNGNHDYCVVDNYRKVVVVDAGGSHRWTYDGQQDEQFNPNCIACDSYQCLVISEHENHKIHLVDKDSHFLKILLIRNDGVGKPTCVCVDKDGKLWVGQKDGMVNVVKYRSKSNT